MDFIISVVKDFYECCNMPVKVISSKFNDIYKIGYSGYFDEIFPLDKIKSLISNSDSHLNVHLYNNIDIYYKIVSISKFNKSSILNKPIENNLHNIPYRSLECSNYMSKLILNIANDKLDKNMNNKSFNPYIRKAIEYVHVNYNQDITIDSLCNYLDINKSYFCSLFKKYTNMSPSKYRISTSLEE